jgi:hypothetical protein
VLVEYYLADGALGKFIESTKSMLISVTTAALTGWTSHLRYISREVEITVFEKKLLRISFNKVATLVPNCKMMKTGAIELVRKSHKLAVSVAVNLK